TSGQQDLIGKDDGFLQVFDTAIPSRARLTCPIGLSIKSVKDHNGKTTQGVFAKKIIQVRTKFGPLLAPVKCRQRSQPPEVPPSDGIPVGAGGDGLHIQEQQGGVVDHSVLSTEQIQEVAMDQHNVEHQDIVQQALGIVKVTEQQIMADEIQQQGLSGPYGDVSTTIPHSLPANSMTDTVSLVTTLASGDMTAAGQYAATLDTEQQQQLIVAGLMTQSHLPLHSSYAPVYTQPITITDNTKQINGQVTEETGSMVEKNNGKSLKKEMVDPADQEFELKIFHEDGYEDCLDLSDEESCNWMMLVRPARTRAEQNVVAVQLQERIFFISTEPIPSNTEIRVWYSPDYAKQIGKELLLEKKEEKPVIREIPILPIPSPAENIKHRGRPPRKGRPRKYVKPSKTWRARLEKTRLTKLKSSLEPTLPPRKRGRPPKTRNASATKIAEESDDFMHIDPTDVIDMTDEIRDEVKNDEDVTLAMLEDVDDVLDDDDFPYPKPKRRGRKRRPPGAPKIPRIPKKDPLPCPHCGEKFTKEALFVIHVAEHTGIKPFICEVEECGKGFMSKFKLERHRLIHTCPRGHKCPYCDKSFNRKDHLKNHMITHDPNKKRWVCEECGKEYSYNFSYRTHKAFHDADAGRTLECGICRKVHNTREELLYHLKVHSGARSVKNCTEKTHACDDCGKKFYTRKDVRRHMITHTKKKDFLCQYCPQRFGRKDHLTRHLRSSHSGDNSNQKIRTPKGERKVRPEPASMIGLTIPNTDQNLLGSTQQSLNYQLHALPQEFRDVPVPVPIHMFDNQNQQLITLAGATVTQNPIIQAGQQQQQQPQQQQHQVLQAIPQQLANQIQVIDNRYIIDSSAAVRQQQQQQQHIDNTNPNEYRALQAVSQSHVPTMYMQVGQQQQQQQPQQQQQQQIAVANREVNIDLTRNGAVQDYQAVVPRSDQQNPRPTVVQAADNNNRQNTQQAQTFSTLIGYMETLRFLETLPTPSAPNSVLAQMTMQQTDGQQATATMIPIQPSLAYTTATSITAQQLPVADIQKKVI
ncbi:hypothetical protein FSP39_016618, partial [Pinctada imbricata]